jgi:hypothetical protein
MPLALLAMPIGVRAAFRVVGVARESLTTGAARLSERDAKLVALLSAAPLVASFFLAALLSGALVGRFGGKSGPREAALGAILGAVLISLLGFRPGSSLRVTGIFAVLGMLSLFGAAGGALGAVWGTRSRR